jgi:hypothetical protein
MNGIGDHHIEQNKPYSERQIPHFLSYAYNQTKSHESKQRTIWGGWDPQGTVMGINKIKVHKEHYMLYRKAMQVNSLYSYPSLNLQKPLVLPVIAYTLSSTKLEIRAK